MKRKVFIFSALLFLSLGSAQAQNESAIASENTFLSFASDPTVVRNGNDQYSVSVHYTPDGLRISKSDFAMLCASTGAPSSMSATISGTIPQLQIYDMMIVKDYTFICGHISISMGTSSFLVGFLGYFKAAELDSVGDSIQIFLHVYNEFRWFSKLVAYRDNTGNYKVVGLGRYEASSSISSAIVEDYIMTGSTSTFCFIFPPSFENMYDLVLTSNYVVIVGDELTSPTVTTICIHLANRDNVIFDPIIYTKYLYLSGDHEVNQEMQAVRLGPDFFAVSYVHQDATTELFSTRLRVFEISSMDMVYSQEFQTVDKYEPVELVFDSLKNILTMLHPMPFPTEESLFSSYFVLLQPFATTTYFPNVLFPIKNHYTSLDGFLGRYFLSTGGNHWYYQHMEAPLPNANDCPLSRNILSQILPNLVLSTGFSGSYTPITFSNDSRSTNVNATTIILECTD